MANVHDHKNVSESILYELEREKSKINKAIKEMKEDGSESQYSAAIRKVIFENLVLLQYFKDLKPSQIEYFIKRDWEVEKELTKQTAGNIRSIYRKGKERINEQIEKLKAQQKVEDNEEIKEKDITETLNNLENNGGENLDTETDNKVDGVVEDKQQIASGESKESIKVIDEQTKKENAKESSEVIKEVIKANEEVKQLTIDQKEKVDNMELEIDRLSKRIKELEGENISKNAANESDGLNEDEKYNIELQISDAMELVSNLEMDFVDIKLAKYIVTGAAKFVRRHELLKLENLVDSENINSDIIRAALIAILNKNKFLDL